MIGTYLCSDCDFVYTIEPGNLIRCPRCASKERDRLDAIANESKELEIDAPDARVWVLKSDMRELESVRMKCRSHEEQLVRIATALGRDARHSADGTIAGLVESELGAMRAAIVECDGCGFSYGKRHVADGKTATEDCQVCDNYRLDDTIKYALGLLRPFAAEAGEWCETVKDEWHPVIGEQGAVSDAKFTVGDLRRAATFVAKATA